MTQQSTQRSFNPVDFHFEWTADDWYTWNRQAAMKAARAARSAEAKTLRKQGWNVRLFTLSDQLISRGGIGSGKPHIEMHTSVYFLEATK